MTCPRTPPGRTTNNHYYAGGMCIFCATPDPAYAERHVVHVHLAFPGVQDTLCGQPTTSNKSTQQITESTCTACRAELVQEVAR